MAAFLSVLHEKLTSAASLSHTPYDEIDHEIKKLQKSLSQIEDMLADASQKPIIDRSVERWLNDLHQFAYDIDDILDDLATEAIDRELMDESETHTGKVQSSLDRFSKNSLWIRGMKEKMCDISNKLQVLIEEKCALGLIVKEEESRSKSVISMIGESRIVGREAEKEALVRKLLGEEPCDRNFDVVPIVGMGGIGKTTLARLLYNEPQVKDYFDLMAWVCISNEFDSFSISKVIFEFVTGEIKEFEDLELLLVSLRDHLRGKRFLLVLDDVWSESCEDWETLVGPFHTCAPGSKIIMTTRKDELLKKLGYNDANQLQSLSHDDALSLLALHALGVDNFDSHLSLNPHVVGIVKKCKGLPLVLKALGRLLSTKKDEEEYWKEVLDNEIWMLSVEDEIIPALRLSYTHLLSHLK